jgi:distribution and morphology protein 34
MSTKQANPLNTYLFSKPSFTSPQPLAASSGLTIPLQITLSEIKLSAFIILVFSRQKGLTLVFRNDPLESLKVSSTFDSIPFVRDYLQKEIEAQLRVLMMEELPAIIHRLSLRLWCPEYRAKEDQELAKSEDTDKEDIPVDPLASPPQDAVDARGNVLDANEISSLSLDGSSETHSLFSQKNLLRLAALNDSHRTLSLFTPSIRDAVFRAWAIPSERTDAAGSSTPSTPSLTRTHSHQGSTTYTFTDSGPESGSLPSRPSLLSMQSATTGLSLGAGRHSRAHGNRKKKTRVVNLRKKSVLDDSMSESGESMTSETSSMAVASESSMPTKIPEEPEEDLITPPRSPTTRVRFSKSRESMDAEDSPRRRRPSMGPMTPSRRAERPSLITPPSETRTEPIRIEAEKPAQPRFSRAHHPVFHRAQSPFTPEKLSTSIPVIETPGGGIVEQAWMLKMAGEIARRAHDEKVAAANEGFWASSDRDDCPPPAYEAHKP